MKTKLGLLLLASVTFLSAAPLRQAASRKESSRSAEALVTTLRTVSPDLLGGRLGYSIAAAQASKPTLAVKPAGTTADQLDYQSWKAANKR